MSLGLLFRTVRHLPREQWVQRAKCRGRRLSMRMTPMPYRIALRKIASRLPLPNPGSARLLAAAAPVMALQRAVHGTHDTDIRRGRFTLLGETFDFGSLENISWRGDFHEGDNPLRRMNLAYMGYVVPMLARGEREDLDAVLVLLRSLEAQNRWSVRGVFRDVWNPYAVSHRMINLLIGLALYRDRGGRVAADIETAILQHVRFCAAFVLHNLERDVQYNHLLKNYVAIAVYCSALETAPPQMEFLRLAVPNSIRQTILRDGGHIERSPMYHMLAILDLKVLRGTGLFNDVWQRLLDAAISRMETALGVMSHPDGDIALFNDSWIGEAPRSADVVAPGDVPEIGRLPDTGYVRVGRGGDAVVFDCGACGPDDNPAHAHADFLSFELSVDGERLIVDPGVPTYTAGALRDHARSARAHNGPRVDGMEPIEAWKSFRVGRRGYAGEITDVALAGFAPLWCAGWQSGYAHRGVDVRRFVGLWPGEGALICDLWRGRRIGVEASGFLIPALWDVTSTTPLTLEHDGRTITLSPIVGAMGEVSSASRWRRFGVAEPATHIDVRPADSNDRRQLATWITWSDRHPPAAGQVRKIFDRLGAA